MILFLRFRRATLLLTRGMGRSLCHQQALEATLVGVRHQSGLSKPPFPPRVLLWQDVNLVRVEKAGLQNRAGVARRQIGRAHVWTPVTNLSRLPSFAC